MIASNRHRKFSIPLALLSLSLLGADWTQFRGPGGSAASKDAVPTSWSRDQNIAWKTELPGAGTSSPVTWEDNIFVTCYSGYAVDRDAVGDDRDLMRHLVCIDRGSGRVEWKKDFEPKLPEHDYTRSRNSSWHGYSSSTPATDGKHIYLFFGKTGVFCLDMNGKQVWHADVGSGTNGWGSGSSPVLYKNLVIVNASVESGSLVALDKATGNEAWRTSRMRGIWNTPVLVDTDDGTEVVVSKPGRPIGSLVGLNPENGEELWTCEGINDGGYVCPTVVAHDGIVYAIGGRSNTAVAVRAGGRGDVTSSHQLWSVDRGSNVTSPVYHDGHLYWVHERRGVAYCLDAKSGEIMYEERLVPRTGIVYASSIVAGDKLYYVSQHNGTFVLDAKPEFKLVSHNQLDDSRANASPVANGGRLLLRNDRYLYCIGK